MLRSQRRSSPQDKDLQYNGHDVCKTPSANLAMAANELARLEQMPEVTKVAAMLKATHY